MLGRMISRVIFSLVHKLTDIQYNTVYTVYVSSQMYVYSA